MPLHQFDEQPVMVHFIECLRYINCTHVDCRTRTNIMINHISENINSLSTPRLFFKPKLIITACKQIIIAIQYTVFKYSRYYWTYGNSTKIIDSDRFTVGTSSTLKQFYFIS